MVNYAYELDLYQNTLTFIIVSVSYLFIVGLAVKHRKDIAIVTSLFLWHTLFSIIYFVFSLSSPSDAKGYFARSIINESFTFYPGSPFIQYFASLFTAGFFNTNYLNTTLIINLIGSSGLVLLYLSIKDNLKLIPWYWSLILFIPSMSFWTGSLGKDAFSFFSVCLFIYSITKGRRTTFYIPLSFFIMFMVRPHVAALILVSYTLYFLIQSKVHYTFKLFITPIILLAVFLSLGFVTEYVGIDDASLEGFESYVDGRQNLGSSFNSYIDISSMSFPMKLYTYVFRPQLYEARNLTSFITSTENAILLIIITYVLLKAKSELKLAVKGVNLWLFIYAFLAWSVLANVTTNLGIATRQKWMFMPVIIYLLIYLISIYYWKKRTPNNKPLQVP